MKRHELRVVHLGVHRGPPLVLLGGHVLQQVRLDLSHQGRYLLHAVADVAQSRLQLRQSVLVSRVLLVTLRERRVSQHALHLVLDVRLRVQSGVDERGGCACGFWGRVHTYPLA